MSPLIFFKYESATIFSISNRTTLAVGNIFVNDIMPNFAAFIQLFLTVIWLSLSQLWAIIVGVAALTRC